MLEHRNNLRIYSEFNFLISIVQDMMLGKEISNNFDNEKYFLHPHLIYRSLVLFFYIYFTCLVYLIFSFYTWRFSIQKLSSTFLYKAMLQCMILDIGVWFTKRVKATWYELQFHDWTLDHMIDNINLTYNFLFGIIDILLIIIAAYFYNFFWGVNEVF